MGIARRDFGLVEAEGREVRSRIGMLGKGHFIRLEIGLTVAGLLENSV